LDGLHVATALQLRSTEIVTADQRMAAAAAMCGLKSAPLMALEV
jgi:predicted nucleic acid-binding protein